MTTETKKPQVGKKAAKKEGQKESKAESFHIQVAEMGIYSCNVSAFSSLSASFFSTSVNK